MAGVQRNRGLKAWQGSQLDDITIPKPPTSARSQTPRASVRERGMGVQVTGPRLFITTKQYKLICFILQHYIWRRMKHRGAWSHTTAVTSHLQANNSWVINYTWSHTCTRSNKHSRIQRYTHRERNTQITINEILSTLNKTILQILVNIWERTSLSPQAGDGAHQRASANFQQDHRVIIFIHILVLIQFIFMLLYALFH